MTELDDLRSADREVLVGQWKKLFKRDPPARLNTSFLCRVLSWHAQCEEMGHQPFANARTSSKSKTSPTKGVQSLSPGTRLLREWRGASYEVMVLTIGYEYAGERYKSLSSIARVITGTAWSGPAFFGLKS